MGEDIAKWWAAEYPRLYGKPLPPLAGGVTYFDGETFPDLPTTTLDNCGYTSNDVRGNAFFASCHDGIVYDDAELFPALYAEYKDLALGVVIAHEWGHAIQGRTEWPKSSVTTEVQADCFAGAWLRSGADDFGSKKERSHASMS
jgi:hypothetical protein